MARTMLNDSQLNDKFWGQEIHTSFYIMNKGLLRSDSDKTPYELWTGKSTNVKHFRIFGRRCYIKRDDVKIGKFDSRVDEGIFIGYSSKRKAYKCYNLRLGKIVETINVKIDESISLTNIQKDPDEEDEGEIIQEKEEEENQEEEQQSEVERSTNTQLKPP